MAIKKPLNGPYGARLSNASRESDRIPEQEGIDQLLSNLRLEDGGWNPKGYFKSRGRMENGVNVVTYAFSTTPSDELNEYLLSPEPFETKERDFIQKAMLRIERDSNIVFRETTAKDADFFIFKGKPCDETLAGLCFNNSIILNPAHTQNRYVVLHEIMHVLGASHPGDNGEGQKAGGNNPLFTRDTTIMSYRDGDTPPEDLAALDVAVLHAIYGPPLHPRAIATVSENDLMESRYIFSSQPVTLNLNGSHKGELMVDEMLINGVLQPPSGSDTRVKSRLVGATQWKDINASQSNINLDVVGNSLPNHIQGSKVIDKITPRGGFDVLTGNENLDVFNIDGKSGFFNIITDFNPARDRDILTFQSPVSKVELRYVEGFLHEGQLHKGTEVWARDKDGNAVASVMVIGMSPQQLEGHLELPAANNQVAVSVAQDTPEDCGTHPSGLPFPVLMPRGGNNRRK